MESKSFKLYAGRDISYHSSFEDAKEAALVFIEAEIGLRIEILEELKFGDADFWAYEYDNKKWVPS